MPWVVPVVAVAALILGLVLKATGAFDGSSGARVPDDKTLRLLLVLTAWNDRVGDRVYTTALDTSGQLDITTWDAETEEEIVARGVWKVEKGHLRYDVHYSDDESWIKTGSYVEKVLALGRGPGDSYTFKYRRVSGEAGIVGLAPEGAHKPG
ncbi:MAG: hypothetical protein ACYTEZ_16415 [Planctomycetota bacterium]